MQALEQQAGTILLNFGYEPFIMSNCVQRSRYIPCNLTARKELDDGTIDIVMVKLKISLHPITSLDEAAIFCRDEIKCVKKFFDQAPAEIQSSRFEVWVSIPSNKFQIFEITRDGIREILSAEELSRQEIRGAA
jgi:hypothetical protein